MNQSKEEILEYVMNELIEKGNLDVINDLYGTDYVAHAGGKKHSGTLS